MVEAVSEYYTELQSTSDLKTSACCVGDSVPPSIRRLFKNIHPTVTDRFYGCGSPFPPCLKGLKCLDLGCGTGRDVFVLAQLVGECGQAFGVDQTPAQLQVAEESEDWHREKFGFSKCNTMFQHGQIEKLGFLQAGSIDVVTSNCVLNLVANKLTVLKEVHRVLKQGGELFFSDVFCDRRVDEAAKKDKVLWGECLSGALYRGDFLAAMQAAGFHAFWVVSGEGCRGRSEGGGAVQLSLV